MQEYDQILFKEKVNKHYGTIASIELIKYEHKNKKHKKYKKTFFKKWESSNFIFIVFYYFHYIDIYWRAFMTKENK